MKLSIVIPARNEEGNIENTLRALVHALRAERIQFEIVVVNDGSSDATEAKALAMCGAEPSIRLIRNSSRHGYGLAVRAGLEYCTGDAIAIMMADGSDRPQDLVACYHKLREGFDCVFGSRFVRGATVTGYPLHKLVINRLANLFVMALFGLRYNDVTNAFKCYRREAIEGMWPLLSVHFNLTVEMPLKAIVRGYSYAVIPVDWMNRASGVSKLKLQEMGSRYLFIVLYLWLEKVLSKGDYHRERIELTGEKVHDRHV
jgi:dolichol-phosphate mannosyltransferase